MPRPLAHSRGVSRRFPAGCTLAICTAPVPHATVIPSFSIAKTSPGLPSAVRDDTRAPYNLTSAWLEPDVLVAKAPGRGSYARMDRETEAASAVHSMRAMGRSIFGAYVASDSS